MSDSSVYPKSTHQAIIETKEKHANADIIDVDSTNPTSSWESSPADMAKAAQEQLGRF